MASYREKEKRLQNIKRKPQKIRRSARLKKASELQKRGGDTTSGLKRSIEENSAPLPLQSQRGFRIFEDPANHKPPEQRQKRESSPICPSFRQTFGQDVAHSIISASRKTHIRHWAETNKWPEEFFQKTDMPYLFARKNFAPFPLQGWSESSLDAVTTPSDRRPREEKSAPYRNPIYSSLLETRGGLHMIKSELGISDVSKSLCHRLLEKKYAVPENTIFRDGAFDEACQKLRDKNEARIMQDIARLLVPSVETLATLGDERFGVLVESINEGWNNCIPVLNPRPQPDYAVGFGRCAFSEDHFNKLKPALGDPLYKSYFMATYYMQFPFLTVETKCGTQGLDIADRQNAHSMNLAIRGIFELFKLRGREKELHQKILTFSITHDNQTVRLYGYYPIIDGSKVKIHRERIRTFDFTVRDGLEKWTTRNFILAVYEESLTLLDKIRSVIDELPPDFSLPLSLI
ncbi:MAG: hypothetical protein M1834_008989 [Cirrosporium novae-zelandiae]|nr:MAG: hypothetical protein M1834_008989 [Cirrosporium novae-zelandiae]